MLTRHVCLLLALLAVPAAGQQAPNPQVRITQKTQWHDEMNMGAAPIQLNTNAARLQAIHHDADELSALSASVQSDLQQLQKGVLVKDLNEKLKKMEKLSKKLRQNME